MRKNILSLILFAVILAGCTSKKDTASADEECCEGQFSCKLTTAELQERKGIVIASLKKQMLEKKELENGYAFKFPGTDKMVDELTEFIKTERECCDFFAFNLSVTGDKKEAWLELTGADGIKTFITSELGF